MYPPHYIETHLKELMKPEVACTLCLVELRSSQRRIQYGHSECTNRYVIFICVFMPSKRPELCVRGMVFGFKTEFGRQIGFEQDISEVKMVHWPLHETHG
jgi:hypothetical protein